MAEPEINEAAAVETAEAFLRFVKPTSEIGVVARAALRWKARAAAWERIAIRYKASFDIVTIRAEAAEAERDRLRKDRDDLERWSR